MREAGNPGMTDEEVCIIIYILFQVIVIKGGKMGGMGYGSKLVICCMGLKHKMGPKDPKTF